MANTRHYGIASLGVQSAIFSASQSFCESFDPLSPTSLIQAGVMAFTVFITALDWKKAHK